MKKNLYPGSIQQTENVLVVGSHMETRTRAGRAFEQLGSHIIHVAAAGKHLETVLEHLAKEGIPIHGIFLDGQLDPAQKARILTHVMEAQVPGIDNVVFVTNGNPSFAPGGSDILANTLLESQDVLSLQDIPANRWAGRLAAYFALNRQETY